MDIPEKKQLSIIILNDVTKSFTILNETFVLFADICTTFVQGKSYGLSGQSGSGKSTLLNIIAGIDNPTTGAVIVDGEDLAYYTPNEKSSYLHKHIGFMFQYPYLISELNVIENVMTKGLIDNNPDEAYAHTLLAAVGLADKADLSPVILSGGEQQRVALARALYSRPQFLIADEPTAHLDENNSNLILSLIEQAQREFDLGVIIASHDKRVTERMQIQLRIEDKKLVVG